MKSLPAALAAALWVLTGCTSSSGTVGSGPGGYTPRTPAGSSGPVVTAPGGRISSAEIGLAAAPGVAWPALVEVYRELGFDAATFDPRSHTAALRRQRAPRRIGGARPSTFFDCGRSALGTNADTYTVEIDLASTLSPGDGGGTMLRTTVGARATSPTGGGAVACGSTGALEGRIADLLRGRLGEGP